MNIERQRERWAAQAKELQFSFSPGLSGLLQSKIIDKFIRDQKLDIQQVQKALEIPFFGGMMEDAFLGVSSGDVDGCSFFLYQRSSKQQRNATFTVHLTLLFEKSGDIGLSIYKEGFWSRVGKFLGAQDIQLQNPILDPMVMIKAKDTMKAERILQKTGVQQALISLFQHSDGFEVSDTGIEYKAKGKYLETKTIEALMRRMVVANRFLASAITSP